VPLSGITDAAMSVSVRAQHNAIPIARYRSPSTIPRSDAGRVVGVEPRAERHAVENFMRVPVDHPENTVFARRGDGSARVYFKDRIGANLIFAAMRATR
jgi:hypothetical protein